VSVWSLALRAPEPFELPLVLFGHGWIDLPPHEWDAERGVLKSAIALGRRAVDVELVARRGRLVARVTGAKATERPRVKAALTRMLRLDEDLDEFWALCAREQRLAWVAHRGAGRLMRSASVFEDLAKLLMTTNCSWAATRNMVRRTTDALGSRAPSGRRAFPSARAAAAESERFYREEARMGYRAGAMRRIAAGFAEGRLTERAFLDPRASTDELRRRLLDLPGFGPYAAGQALRLLGRYDDLALDSWCRARLALGEKSGRAPADRTIARRYAKFAQYRGLALWMDLTAHWHGEAEEPSDGVLAARR
jgi:3-methyladenine DNA glycosylase/8-oxoguanine DNA glycosylase